MKLLVYDPVHQGHHGEYLAHLLRHLVELASVAEATFVVHPEFLRGHADLVREASATGRIRFEEEAVRRSSEESTARGLARRSFREWAVVEREARERKVDHCLLMELNPLQLALAVPRLRRLPFEVHGILFHPYPRLRTGDDSPWHRLARAASRVRKRWILRRVIRDPAVRSVFILNDRECVKELNRELADDGAPFVYLPDPVPRPPVGGTKRSPPGRGGSTSSEIVVVTPGAIRRNKGVLEALDAFMHLDSELSRRIVYRVPGRIEEGLRRDLDRRLGRLCRESELNVRFEDRFLTDEEFREAIAGADLVLVPYRRTEGSSGILGHAAREGVPVLGPEEGLVGRLIREYELGLTADTSDPVALGGVIAQAVREADHLRDTAGMARYVEERSPDAFAESIVGRIDPRVTGRPEAG